MWRGPRASLADRALRQGAPDRGQGPRPVQVPPRRARAQVRLPAQDLAAGERLLLAPGLLSVLPDGLQINAYSNYNSD